MQLAVQGTAPDELLARCAAMRLLPSSVTSVLAGDQFRDLSIKTKGPV